MHYVLGGMGEGAGRSLRLYPGTAVSARAGCGGGVALLVPPPTPNARRLHPSAAIYATLDQRRGFAASALHRWNQGEEQRPDEAAADQRQQVPSRTENGRELAHRETGWM